MAGFEQIESVLRRAGRRRRWQRAWRGFFWGLLSGAGVWLLALGLFKILPLPIATLGWSALLALLGPPLGFFLGWRRPEPPLATARWLDLQQGLQERVSTAVELTARSAGNPWGHLVVNDAAARLDSVNLGALLPHHLPRTARHTVLVLALAAGLGFVPEYRSARHLEAQRERDAVQEAGQRLAELTRRSLDHRPPALETTRQNLEAVEQLGQQLARRPLSRDEALRDLARLTEQVGDQLRELGNKPALRSLEREARNSTANTPGAAEQLEQQIAALQKQMGRTSPEPDALEKLADALNQARQAASEMAAGNEGQDAARADLAQSLADLARMAQELGASLPGLEEALAAFQAGQIDQALQNLDLATQDLQKLLEMAKSLQQLQQRGAQLGRNLKEQLERGQAGPASNTLRQMARQLQSSSLSPDQLQKLMQDLAEALDPAAEYGEVKDLLEQGLRQMQSGQMPQAAQSLSDAAQALENLMEQLGDAQSLQATLAALQRAQLCVGNCTGWGQTAGVPNPGFKPGGKPGAGVGTWADDSLALSPPDSGLWDNSGVVRPDLDPRGLTDRGEGLPPDNLSPSRVQGQFNPGGPMPGITLRGVSIAGQSRVALQEAMATAQTEAQSALSQDEIPRAYQGAVRNYFDDLKD